VPDTPGPIHVPQGLERMGQVKTVVFPTDVPPADETDAHKMYVKTHGAYDPGEQRSRAYDWQRTGVNPITHSFGAVDKDNYQQGVRKALQPGLDQTLQVREPRRRCCASPGRTATHCPLLLLQSIKTGVNYEPFTTTLHFSHPAVNERQNSFPCPLNLIPPAATRKGQQQDLRGLQGIINRLPRQDQEAGRRGQAASRRPCVRPAVAAVRSRGRRGPAAAGQLLGGRAGP